MKSSSHFFVPISLTIFLGLASCSPPPTSFLKLGQPAISKTDSRRDLWARPQLSDALALNYADGVATNFRCQSTGLRISREASNSLQVILAALAGAGALFDFGDKTVGVLALGSSSIPTFQKIFNTGERAKSYSDATRMIEESIIEYLAFNQQPRPDLLTQNGVTLIQRVTASVHLVEKTLTGALATIEDLQKATEPMTTKGAVQTSAGSVPANNVAANAEAARLKRAVEKSVRLPAPPDRKIPVVVDAPPPTHEEFISAVEALATAKGFSEEDKNEPLIGTILDSAGIPHPHDNTMNGLLTHFEDATALQKDQLLDAVKDQK